MESIPSSLVYAAIAILLMAISVFVVKIVISFDVSAWIKHKSENKKHKLKMLCTHTQITLKSEKNVEYKPLFVSPPGTTIWICSRCNIQTYDSDFPKRIAEFYVNNLDVYFKEEEKFQRCLRRYYGV